jgi:hypothetical protein
LAGWLLGKIADLVPLGANPLDDAESAVRQQGVMLHGKWFPESELQSALVKRDTEAGH